MLAFVNGMGGTPLIELYLLYGEVERQLRAAGLEPVRNLVGSYITLARDGRGVGDPARAG